MIGQDSKVIFVRHGSVYVRVSSTRLVKCEKEFSNDGSKAVSNMAGEHNSNKELIDDDDKEDIDDGNDEREMQENESGNEEIAGDADASAANEVPIVDVGEGDQQGVGEIQGDEENNVNLDDSTVSKNPAKYTFIDYRMKTDNNWKEAIVLGRAGKSTGMYKKWYNIKDTETGIHKSEF